MTAFALSIELTLLVALWLSLSVWQKDRATPGRLTFTLLALSAAAWCIGELMHERGMASELVADRICYLGILALPPFWVGAAAHGARLELARRVPWFPVVLLAPALGAYALMYTGPWSSLFVVALDGSNHLRGPVWWILTTYSFLMLVTGSAILIVSALRGRRRAGRLRQLLLGIASLVPLVAKLAYMFSGLDWEIDPTAALLGLALIVLRGAIFSGGLLQALPISQHDLLRQLPLAALLTDPRGTVLAMNPAAERRLGMPEREALGRAFDAVIDDTEDRPRTDVTPLRSQGEESGQLILLDLPKTRA